MRAGMALSMLLGVVYAHVASPGPSAGTPVAYAGAAAGAAAGLFPRPPDAGHGASGTPTPAPPAQVGARPSPFEGEAQPGDWETPRGKAEPAGGHGLPAACAGNGGADKVSTGGTCSTGPLATSGSDGRSQPGAVPILGARKAAPRRAPPATAAARSLRPVWAREGFRHPQLPNRHP